LVVIEVYPDAIEVGLLVPIPTFPPNILNGLAYILVGTFAV
jgi:hypothetical protein